MSHGDENSPRLDLSARGGPLFAECFQVMTVTLEHPGLSDNELAATLDIEPDHLKETQDLCRHQQAARDMEGAMLRFVTTANPRVVDDVFFNAGLMFPRRQFSLVDARCLRLLDETPGLVQEEIAELAKGATEHVRQALRELMKDLQVTRPVDILGAMEKEYPTILSQIRRGVEFPLPSFQGTQAKLAKAVLRLGADRPSILKREAGPLEVTIEAEINRLRRTLRARERGRIVAALVHYFAPETVDLIRDFGERKFHLFANGGISPRFVFA